MNNSHLVVVNNDTFPIHIQNSFCGFVKAGGGGYPGQLADLMSVRKGDLLFFYLNYVDEKFLFHPENKFAPGYYGICRVASEPFFHDTDLSGSGDFVNQNIFGSSRSREYSQLLKPGKSPLVLPLRFKIEKIADLEYTHSVDDNLAYVDKSDEGQLWTLLFKKINKAGQRRGLTPLLPEESSKIARLLFKVNQQEVDERMQRLWKSSASYSAEIRKENLLAPDLEPMPGNDKSIRYENMLVAYIVKNIDKGIPGLEEITGNLDDLEFFGNHIQYGISGDTVDILLLHRKRISDNVEFRYKATVIEVKRDKIGPNDVEQASRYARWIAQLVTFNNLNAIQPVVIGKKPSQKRSIDKIRDKISTLERKGITKPILVEYERHNSRIAFREFDL